MLKYGLAWFPMVVIAVLNGMLRECVYGKFVTELRAHQISTLLGGIFLGAYMAGVIGLWIPGSAGLALAVGVLWFMLTVCFEFLFGRFVGKHSWKRLLRDYNVFAGRVWILLLIWVGLAPYVFFSVMR